MDLWENKREYEDSKQKVNTAIIKSRIKRQKAGKSTNRKVIHDVGEATQKEEKLHTTTALDIR